MLNILVINGSPRGEQSNSQKMCSSFLKSFKELSSIYNIETLILKEKEFSSCKGCFGCWTDDKSICVIQDDMQNMLDSYVNADIIIWVTPLYHYTISSLLKQFIERTLPVNSPIQIKNGDSYNHPTRYEKLNEQKHILISACGFPEHNNFNSMKEYMSGISGGNLVETIFCGMSELFKVESLEKGLNWYFEALETAGSEFVTFGSIQQNTKDILEKPLVEEELFLQMANMHWNCGVVDKTPNIQKIYSSNYKGKGFQFLENMKTRFNTNNNLGIIGNLEFSFEDINESAYFSIDNNELKLVPGRSNEFLLKIITTFENWLKVSSGEVDGPTALMKGLYRIEGDMSILMKMDTLFVTDNNKESVTAKSNISDTKFYGIRGFKWMSIDFIPWIISWVCIEFNTALGSFLPLFISGIILILKKRKNSVTFFEISNGLYFLGLSIFSVYFRDELLLNGVYINYFSIAAIWGISVFGNSSLTADYSIFNQEKDMSTNIIFHKTNEIITLFWTMIYIIQGVSKIVLVHHGLGHYSILLYLLLILGFRFTSVFSKWYPEYIAKRVRL